MGFGLRALNRLAGSDLLDRLGIRKQAEQAALQRHQHGFRTATAAGRTFKAAPEAGQTGAPGARQVAQASST